MLIRRGRRWEASPGLRVDAVRTTEVVSLPPTLVLHLKRFAWDFERMARVKTREPFPFPSTLPAEAVGGTACSAAYHLHAVMLHAGSARGGHYFCWVRQGGDGVWCEFNDARVRPLAAEEVAAVEGATAGDDETVTRTRDALLRDAYMLWYTRRAGPPPGSGLRVEPWPACELKPESGAPTHGVPPTLAAEIAAGAAELRQCAALVAVRRSMAELNVHWRTEEGGACTLDLPLSTTLAQATAAAASRLGGAAASTEPGDCRLRVFDPHTGRPGATFGGREELSLGDLGVFGSGAQTHFLFELRGAGDPPFAEWDPEAVIVQLVRWPQGAAEGAPDPTDRAAVGRLLAGDGSAWGSMPVTVTRDDQADGIATLRSLATAVATSTGVLAGDQRLTRIDVGRRRAVEVCGDGFATLRSLGFRDDTVVVVESIAAAATAEAAAAATMLHRARDCVRVAFNSPLEAPHCALGEAPGEIPASRIQLMAELDVLQPISEAKVAMIAAVAAAAPGSAIDPDEVHIRRGCRVGSDAVSVGARVKDETRALKTLDLYDGAVLLLMPGAPLGAGVVIVDVVEPTGAGAARLCQGATAELAAVTSLPIPETWLGSQLRALLAERLKIQAPMLILRPLAADNRPTGRGTLGPMLADDVTLRAATKGKLGDGSALVVQRSERPLTRLTRKTIAIVTRGWTPGWPGRPGALSDPRELILAKTATLGELKEVIAAGNEDDEEPKPLLVAKWSRFITKTKPLSFSNARSLDWEAGADDALKLDSLKLRADHIVVFCEAAAFRTAAERIAESRAAKLKALDDGVAAASAELATCRAAVLEAVGGDEVACSTVLDGENPPTALAELVRAHAAAVAAVAKAEAARRGGGAKAKGAPATRIHGRVPRFAARDGGGVTLSRGRVAAVAAAKLCAGGCGWDLGEGNPATHCSTCCAKKV